MGDNLMRDVLDRTVDTALRIAALQRKNAELQAALTEAQEKLAAYEEAFPPRVNILSNDNNRNVTERGV